MPSKLEKDDAQADPTTLSGKADMAGVSEQIDTSSRGPEAAALTYDLISGECPRRFLFKVGILGLFDSDADGEYRPALELPRSFVLLADGVSAVISDAEPVTRQRELSGLGAHWAFGYDLVVDIEFGLPD